MPPSAGLLLGLQDELQKERQEKLERHTKVLFSVMSHPLLVTIWSKEQQTLLFLPHRLDDDGRLEKIHLNNATRDSVLDIPLEQVQPFYRALRAITDIGNRPENMVAYKMDPGE